MFQGVLFDKDGTLFDFEASWNGWAAAALTELGGGDHARVAHLAARIDFDMERGRFLPGSVAIAGTLDETAAALLPDADASDQATLANWLMARAVETEMVEAVPLRPFLQGLRARGFRLGVATNDAEAPARAHLAAARITDCFEFIAGADSGFGPKPDPGMCLGFAAVLNLAPETVVMVGDSRHDLIAGRAAGMATVGVLTGLAVAAELQDLADVVLPDIGHLPAWLETTAHPILADQRPKPT